jgi:hypothetical protein
MGSISSSLGDAKRLEAFIAHWQSGEGGQERANYALFLTQFWAALGLPDPDPADHDHQTMTTCSSAWSKRLPGLAPWPIVGPTYKRNCIVLEAKQSRQERGGDKEVLGHPDLFACWPHWHAWASSARRMAARRLDCGGWHRWLRKPVGSFAGLPTIFGSSVPIVSGGSQGYPGTSCNVLRSL